ncbi:MAG: ABC transporter permease [Halobacteriota archaeon]|uniref:ABC transporter permease n=1 Tax=Natronomonas sp. TaxID=2184060 RepID=UPI003974957A
MSTPTESSRDAREATERASSRRTPSALAILRTLIRRELSTAVLDRTYIGLWIGFVGVLFGIAWIGGGMQVGYVSTIIDLLTPLELLIPVIAFAFGYRAIVDDERRGVLDVLRTYPVSSWQVVAGVYLGRAIGLAAIVSTALSALMFPIFVTESYRPVFYATHTGADSPGLYLRFVVLTVGFALAMLAVAVAISALVGTARTAIAIASVTLLAVLFVADIALVFGVARGLIAETSLVSSLAISPLSAYRGLVFEATVAVTAGTGPRVASPVASAIGLGVWWLGSLAVAAVAIRK